jgi:hypothetical protein
VTRRGSPSEHDDYLEEREARIQEIIVRVKHHQDQAEKHLTQVRRLQAKLKQRSAGTRRVTR